MFEIKKLVLIAACVALSLGPSIAKIETSHVRIHIRTHDDIAAESTSGSAGDEVVTSKPTLGGYSVDENSSKSNTTNPSTDDSDDTIDVTILVDELCTGKGESPMSVEGVEGVFCVTGQPCVVDIADGACPGPQEDLEFGASCGKVITGVDGCKPTAVTRLLHHKRDSSKPDKRTATKDKKTKHKKTLHTKKH
ncbi:hypothetical protein FI667_g9318, partial [Globisporangium splendens]